MTEIASLPARAVIEVSGADRVSFLQGIVSNDVEQAAPGRAVWAALLTPQGKWLADFFVLADGERLLLDVEAAQADMLATKLSRFKLRAKVAVARRPELAVFVAWGGLPDATGATATAPDPRLPDAGWRLISATPLHTDATAEQWDTHRLALGLPDGSRDMEADKSVLLEAGFDELHGVSWTKGCYMGQELTARTRYRGLVKRRLVIVSAPAGVPADGTAVLRGGAVVGTMRSGRGTIGLALLRLDALDGALECGGTELIARVPDWLVLPKPAASTDLTAAASTAATALADATDQPVT